MLFLAFETKQAYNISCSFQIFTCVMKDGSGIQMTKDVCKSHAQEVLQDLNHVPDCESKTALVKIVNYLMIH